MAAPAAKASRIAFNIGLLLELDTDFNDQTTERMPEYA